MTLTDKLTAIADAIRAKTGTTDTMTLAEMPSKIEAIETGSSGATEPYVEETYDEDGNLIAAKLVGHTKVRIYGLFSCSSLTAITLPEGLTSIGDRAFYGCSSLTAITLPEGLTSIGNYAFCNCTSLTLDEVPAGITSIGDNSFRGCVAFTELTFKSTPTAISDTAFSVCNNLTTINVPWSEGVVANAPWGATDATINYDYVEETE